MLIFANNTIEAKQLSNQYRQKKLLRIYKGVYSDELNVPLEKTTLRHWMEIIGHTFPDSVLSFRTAIDLKPYPYEDGHIIFLTSTYYKTIKLPGLTVKIIKGNPLDYVEQVTPQLKRSIASRAYLENLSIVRSNDLKGIKTLTQDELERKLAKALFHRDELGLNSIRDEARTIAQALGLDHEFSQLNRIISALLSTHDDILHNPYAKAVAKKKPFDENRVQLFDDFILYLNQCRFIERPFRFDKVAFKNLSFYESYFSNYIEGTEFLIDEAEDIVFQKFEMKGRHADSHDVLANYMLTSNTTEMATTPNTVHEFIELLQERHATLMKERPDKQPGEFKSSDNKAGNTIFVSAKDLLGTLTLGFERYQMLNAGLEKALFMQFLITETHPFVDGNGRLSRIMMNAELVRHGQCKIIIPTVHRDNYMNGLRLITREQQFKTYIKVMDQAHAYTYSIDWMNYGEAREKIESNCAHQQPDEGLPIFNRALRELRLSGYG